MPSVEFMNLFFLFPMLWANKLECLSTKNLYSLVCCLWVTKKISLMTLMPSVEFMKLFLLGANMLEGLYTKNLFKHVCCLWVTKKVKVSSH
jgi:hypothetical protein